ARPRSLRAVGPPPGSAVAAAGAGRDRPRRGGGAHRRRDGARGVDGGAGRARGDRTAGRAAAPLPLSRRPGRRVRSLPAPCPPAPRRTTVALMWQMMDLLYGHKKEMVSPEDALPGRDRYPYPLAREHMVLGTDMLGPDAPVDPQPWPIGAEELILAGGCFWGIERIAW